MASNKFLSSPYDDAISSVDDAQASRFVPVPPPATEPPAPASAPAPAAVAARGIQPTREDVARRAQELGVDPKLALSFFSQESSGNWNSADSNKGARGGMQVMPGTYKSMMGTDAGQRDPWNNMEAGLRYISYGQKALKTKDPELLAAGYHAGYDRADLKAGRIPGTNDGSITTAAYAKSVAARVNGAGGTGTGTGTGGDAGRYVPLSDAEAAQYQPSAEDAGRYQPLSEDEADSFTKSLDGGIVSDIGKNLKLGMNMAAQDTRELVGRIPGIGQPIVKGLDAVDEYFSGKPSEKLLKDDNAKVTATMTPAMQDALGKKWWDSDKGKLGDAWSDPRAYMGGVIQSLPEQALTMGPSMALAKYAYGAKVAAGAAQAAAAATAARTAAIAGSLTEGLLGGAQSSREVRDKIMEMKPDVLEQSDAYMALLSSGMSAKQAQTALANDSATRAFVTSGVTTGMFGGMGDRAIAKIFVDTAGKATIKKVLGNVGKGALAEGLFEELPQSVTQQLSQNEALQKANPKQDIMEDVVNQGLGGMVQGGLQGGGMAVAASSHSRRASPEVAPSVAPAAPGDQVAVSPAAQAAPLQEMPGQPSAAPGPLERATENASAPAERVTVTTPQGSMTGTMTHASADGQAVVVGDDGQVYRFKVGENGVQMTPEAPNTPLSNAVEVALGDDVAQAAATEQPAAAPAVPAAVEAPAPAATAETAPAATEKVAPSLQLDTAAMTTDELRGRLKYLAEQGKSTGWNKMLIGQRRLVEKEINTRAAATEQASPAVSREVAETTSASAPAATETVAQTTPAQEQQAALPADLAGAKPRYNYGNKSFELNFVSDTDRAAYIAAQDKPSKRDAEYLQHAMQSTGMTEAEVRAHGQAVRAAIKEQAQDAKPGTLKVAELPRGVEAKAPAPAPVEPAPEPTPKPLEVNPAPAHVEPASAAIENVAAVAAPEANKWFGSREKADAYIAKKKLTGTHEVAQTGKVRFEVKAKANSDGITRSKHNYAEVKLFGAKHFVTPYEDGFSIRTGSGEIAKDSQRNRLFFKTEADAIQYASENAQSLKKEPNGNDNNPQGKQASTEEVAENSDTEQIAMAVRNADQQGLTGTKRAAAVVDELAARWGMLGDEVAEYSLVKRLLARPPTKEAKAAATDRFIEGVKRRAIEAGRKMEQEADAEPEQAATVQPEASAKEEVAAPAANDPFADNKVFTSEAVAKARARLKSKLSGAQLNSGIDPELLMDGLVVAGAHIESGTRKFAAYAKAMTDDLGEAIKPYLLSFYEAARNYPGLDNAEMTPVAQAKAEFDALNTKAEDQPNEKPQQGEPNGSQKLDQPSPRELAGKQPDAVQGAEPGRQAERGAEGRGRADAPRDDGAGAIRAQQPGSLGDDAREVSAAATRAGDGRGNEQGREPVQRSKRAAKPDPASGGQLDLVPASGTRAPDRADDFVITEDDAIGEGGAKTKFKQNLAAVRLLQQLTAENRQATRDEQAVLAKYVGWGGIPQAFYRDNAEVSKGWEKEAAELKAALTDDELAAAATSTRNAHYTSPEIVGGVWDAVRRFGFQGGRTLEPSVGVGNFFGLMPTALRSASQLTGVELDHITGGIAKQLYPMANVQAPVGFQDFTAPDNYFDLAIGNPPFGREGIYDPRRRKISGFSIHNYFFAKSIDTVKPNGVLAMVVTNRLLDSAGDKARQYIASRSEFLGAIRLPNDAFAKNAGTQVTTDIIFLRKLKDGEAPTGNAWMEVKQYKDAAGKLVPLNEYFVKHPDMMLGDFGAYGSMYSPDDAALVAKPGQDTPALLQAAIAKLPQGFMDAPTHAPALESAESAGDISHVKTGSVFEQGGQIFERREDMLGKQQAVPVSFPSEKARERVAGMIGVRDALVTVRDLQLRDNATEAGLAAARADLNRSYDAFVKAHGPLNADANKRLMRDDPSWPQIAALEDGFDKGISRAVAKNTGETPREPSARKAAIFSTRTQSPYKAPESAKSAKDAMVSSLAERGRVDLDYMASLYAGHTPEQIAKELDGLIFKSPAGGWESRDQYLSGNVKKKLAQAIAAAKTDPAMRSNVEALKAVQPADIEAVDIDAKTGAHWVPTDVMQDFIHSVTGGERAKAVYNPVTASWTLSVERPTSANVAEYSTDRASLTTVLEAAANQKQITIYDKHADGSRTANEQATLAANAKVERVKAEWKNWLWTDDARRERLARIYNDTFNTDVQREFDGSHLKFPGKVGDDIIQFRPHQYNAVWRAIQSFTTLLDHVVGAGKTYEMIAIIMEMRRMGLAKKPVLAVPNHLVGQWATDFMKLYPGANILAATKKDFEKDNRKKLFARIATGDWDAVIVAHSSFGKVEVEPEFQSAFIKQQIADMDTSIASMRAAEGKGSRNVKQIEKQKAALEEKLKKLFDTGSKDDNLYFGELGIDAVLLDEAHEFKNLGFSTGMQRVAGLGNPAGSNKAADMFMKIQSTLQRTGGKNVVFATGTPISNTMAEMYTMQRFLDYGTLKDQGIAHFDAWAKTFGEVVTDWELSPSGQYKMNSRFAKFVNMPELMQRYQSFSDVVNRDDINRMLASQGKKLPVPKIRGGKPENTVVERSADQAAFIGVPTVDENGVEKYPEGSLIYRSENLPKKAVKGGDNMLKIMSDARKAALDMRLIDPSYPDNPGSKVNVAADNILSIHAKTSADRGTQLVFIDLSTPKSAVAKETAALRELVARAEEGDEAAQEKLDAMSPDELLALDSKFSVYDDLKAKLIARGIPENEIAFIHDAGTELQKEDLFGKVRSSRVRVLLGSTAKMGAGMNVQDCLVALHHLDAPWRPSDLEQREGRIIRQGNLLYNADPEGFEIDIKRYATKQTLDSRMWQTIEAKARFIEQVRKGTGEREVEDVAGEAANSAEMKAASSGNPLILEEMSLRQAIRKLDNQQAEHNREQHRIKDRIRWAGEFAKKQDAQAKTMEADAPLAPKAFAVKIGAQTFDKHGEAGEAILQAVDAMAAAGAESREIGSYGGFKLTVDDTSHGNTRQAVLTLDGAGSYQVEANPGSSSTGLGLRLQNTVKSLAEDAKQARAAAARERAEVPKLEAKVKPWGGSDDLAEAKTRHNAVIEQLRPKKAPAATPAGEAPALSRESTEALFKGLEGLGMTKKEAQAAIDARPDAAAIRYVENHFWDLLAEIDDSGRVTIKC